MALIGAAILGLGMGTHKSLIPAAVAPMVPVDRRASAFGLFTAGYGVFWFWGAPRSVDWASASATSAIPRLRSSVSARAPASSRG